MAGTGSMPSVYGGETMSSTSRNVLDPDVIAHARRVREHLEFYQVMPSILVFEYDDIVRHCPILTIEVTRGGDMLRIVTEDVEEYVSVDDPRLNPTVERYYDLRLVGLSNVTGSHVLRVKRFQAVDTGDYTEDQIIRSVDEFHIEVDDDR